MERFAWWIHTTPSQITLTYSSLEFWPCRAWKWGTLSFSWSWVCWNYLRSKTMVFDSSWCEARISSQQNHTSVVFWRLCQSQIWNWSLWMYIEAGRSDLFSRQVVACYTQLRYKCFYIDFLKPLNVFTVHVILLVDGHLWNFCMLFCAAHIFNQKVFWLWMSFSSWNFKCNGLCNSK